VGKKKHRESPPDGSKLARSMTADLIEDAINHHLRYSLGKTAADANREEIYRALALGIRDHLVDAMLDTRARQRKAGRKRVVYLSMEFLIGRLLGNNLANLGLMKACSKALSRLGVSLQDTLEAEYDPALGNGGLGRLAACFMDSIATLDIAGFGYGINYEYGLFRQTFADGYQREQPDRWKVHGAPWQLERHDLSCMIPLYGRIEEVENANGERVSAWVDWRLIIGVPHDMPVVGYGGKTVNYLRLYSAEASDDFDMSVFNSGDYIRAVEQKIQTETISKVLYPSDAVQRGKELRLVQEYFFVACAIRDIIRELLADGEPIENLADHVAIQMNDTHPALAVPELMRILLDEHDLDWDVAWSITQRTLAFTNHTLLPEALEKWSVSLIDHVLPRHLQLIYEINHHHMQVIESRYADDPERRAALSIIEEGHEKQVNMANLAVIGSHSVNGVAALHSELLKANLMPHFHALWPERFNNKTNGVTQRRWMLSCNPELSALINERIGDGWITNLDEIAGLEPAADDAEFVARFMQVKAHNKVALAHLIKETTRIDVDPLSLFDCQAKRVHEYKRQLLNAMHIIYQYLRMVEDDVLPAVPRTYVFAGKAAPGYAMAKLIIKLINSVASVVNADPRANEHLRVAFIPDYKVSIAERLIPAADVSEQISTAGMEASGTGNMKFAMNGALTIGTLDGANVEIAEEVGKDNIYIFGLTAAQVQSMREDNLYDPRAVYRESVIARRVMDAIGSDRFCSREPGLFQPIVDNILNHGDYYFHLADLDSYVEAQTRISEDFKDEEKWGQRALLNVARMSRFSSDRTIRQYASEIWHAQANV
jgi:starch phosphorylase